MARAKVHENGKLDEAMTALVQSQAIMVQTQAALVAQLAAHKVESDKQSAELKIKQVEVDKELAKAERMVENRFARIEAALIEHSRILQSLANMVGEKIGFKVPQAPKSEQ